MSRQGDFKLQKVASVCSHLLMLLVNFTYCVIDNSTVLFLQTVTFAKL